MSSHVDLPEDIWKLVLQQVPLKQRLSSCALVCKKFKAAGVAATDSIEATLINQPAVDNFATYLQQHGRNLTSLILSGDCTDGIDWPQLEQLPCQHLQELHLISLNLGWGADEDRPNVLDNATAITRLELEDANIYSAALSVLPSLQHLSINGCYLFDSKDKDNMVSAFAFARLQQLTHLNLFGVDIEAESLAYLSSITGLHTLHIVGCCDLTSSTPGLSLPPSLQHLELRDAFEPSVLAAATQLTHLDLKCQWVSDEGDASVGACLLGVLSKLQHLEYLRLSLLHINWPPASPAYQALVASSNKLRVLRVELCRLPDGAFAHIFPSAPALVVLPRLEELGVSCIPPYDVPRIVRCCPALQQLALSLIFGTWHLTALNQLSALSRLELSQANCPGIPDPGTAVSIHSVARLTKLQDLALTVHDMPWPVEGSHAPQALLPLTALQGLTRLHSTNGVRRGQLNLKVGALCWIRFRLSRAPGELVHVSSTTCALLMICIRCNWHLCMTQQSDTSTVRPHHKAVSVVFFCTTFHCY